MHTAAMKAYRRLTDDELLHGVETLRKTLVRAGDDLLGNYANPNILETGEEAFEVQITPSLQNGSKNWITSPTTTLEPFYESSWCALRNGRRTRNVVPLPS